MLFGFANSYEVRIALSKIEFVSVLFQRNILIRTCKTNYSNKVNE
jgi:hypothetical protein